jgi:glycosyltransferase involved in cell wall biosynthesis
MNILVLGWRDPKHPLAGGAEQVMHEHMRGWLQGGYNKVTLFSSGVKGLPEKETLDGVEIIRRGDQYFGVKVAAFFYYLKNRKRIDFVVDQFHGIPFFTPLYVKRPKLAVLQEVAGRVWFLNELPFPLNYLVGLFGYLIEPIILLFYKQVPFMVGSNSAKDDLIKMGISDKKITIVPHGVIVYRPAPFPNKEKVKTITFLGALAKDKGIEGAIKAFSILAKKGDFRFWVIGRGSPDYKDFLTSTCEELGIVKKVRFWGYVSQTKKFELLARSYILINPSVREGWGLVNIEANSVATPVVAYASQGLIDSVNDGQSGIICKQNRPDSMAEEVLSLLANKQKYEKLQKSALLWSKGFIWSKSREISLGLIEKIKMRSF